MSDARAGPLQRLQRLGRERRRLLVEAGWEVARASLALAVLPFARAIRTGAIPLRGARDANAADCAWAVEAAARRVPWRAVCIQRGIAAQRVLRRRGIDARLHYGARHAVDSGKLEAHVWVTVEGVAVIGGSEAAGFAEVAAYP